MPVREQRKITVYGVARNGLTADMVLSQAYSRTLYLPPTPTPATLCLPRGNLRMQRPGGVIRTSSYRSTTLLGRAIIPQKPALEQTVPLTQLHRQELKKLPTFPKSGNR